MKIFLNWARRSRELNDGDQIVARVSEGWMSLRETLSVCLVQSMQPHGYSGIEQSEVYIMQEFQIECGWWGEESEAKRKAEDEEARNGERKCMRRVIVTFLCSLKISAKIKEEIPDDEVSVWGGSEAAA